ncbi:hypothetical protein [Streptomyces sp. NPDC050988]|uniref:hypothetical protein n=1 Tax=Streptomyces sp. NPDC050988 TaxID=3365637 RepID=UPI00378B06DE
MLIEHADQRQLTQTLMEDAALWSADALASASGGVAYDDERSAHLLAAWAQVNAAGTNNSVPLFAKHPEANEPWAKLGAELAATADQGAVGLLEKAARRCAAELGPDGRAKLLAQLATGVSPLIRLAGGLDELLEAAALHRRCAGGTEAGWVAGATWIVGALTENARNTTVANLATDRIARLVDDGHGANLWHTWPKVAASMMSTAFLDEMDAPLDPGLPDYPVGLWLRAVQAVHADDERQTEDTVTEFRDQKPGNQRMLCFELAMAIASVRTLPSRRASRRAARGETKEDEALRSAVSDIMDELPADMVERTGRMYALSRRAILAYIDRDAETLAAVIDRVATWDDDPGRMPSPQFRFEFPNQQALAFANQLLHLGEMAGVHITNREAADGAASLIDRYAPSEHKQGARELVTALRTAGKSGVDFNQAVANGPAGLVAFAAMAAGLTQNRRLPLPKERTRLDLMNEIRESEAKALRIPDREIITVSDEEALAFLEQLYGPEYPLPRDPRERTVWEHDVVAIAAQHLLEYPADATTPEQRQALDARIKKVLRAGTTPQRTPPPPDRSNVVRKQPKRSSKRKRK